MIPGFALDDTLNGPVKEFEEFRNKSPELPLTTMLADPWMFASTCRLGAEIAIDPIGKRMLRVPPLADIVAAGRTSG